MTSTTGSMDLITDEISTAGPLTVGTITQLVQPAGRVSWFPPMERNEFTFVVQPDPRDAYIAEQTARFLQLEQELGNANIRIAELEIQCGQWVDAYADAKKYEAQREEMFLARIAQLEAALRRIQNWVKDHEEDAVTRLIAIYAETRSALMPVLVSEPETLMNITAEELEA